MQLIPVLYMGLVGAVRVFGKKIAVIICDRDLCLSDLVIQENSNIGCGAENMIKWELLQKKLVHIENDYPSKVILPSDTFCKSKVSIIRDLLAANSISSGGV